MSVPRAHNPNSIAAADHAMLRQLVRERAGIVLERGKEYFVEMRIGALATEEGFGSVGEVLDALRTEETWGLLHRMVVESLAISETSWFRDLHPWEELRRTILPELAQRRTSDAGVRCWSAACASGQEPYSLAMLAREHLPQLAGSLEIHASDFSAGILRRARDGRYSQIEMNRGLPAPYLVRYFRKDAGHDWRLDQAVRAMVQFRELNLTGPWPALPPMDLVLLRNVLLYFDGDTRRHVLRNLARVLRPGGWLLLGGGETTITMEPSFEPVTLGRTVAFRLKTKDTGR